MRCYGIDVKAGCRSLIRLPHRAWEAEHHRLRRKAHAVSTGAGGAWDIGQGEDLVAADKAGAILAALGGGDNVVEIEPCITRLRCEIQDDTKVDEPALKAAGVHGVLRQGSVVQVVVGPEADTLAADIEDLR
jgi:PTS system N-acetylglucosamine-specific IIB component